MKSRVVICTIELADGGVVPGARKMTIKNDTTKTSATFMQEI